MGRRVCCEGITSLLQRPDTYRPWPSGGNYVHGPYMSGFGLRKLSAVGGDIPDTAAARPADTLHLKFRVKYLQVKLIMRMQECNRRAYRLHMFITRPIGASGLLQRFTRIFSEFVVTCR